MATLAGIKPPRPPASRASRAAAAGAVTISATEAQNEFGRVLESATREQDVIITRHNVPRAVLVSVDRYRELVGTEAVLLDALTEEFDAMLSRMQAPAVRAGTERGFAASPREMGKAAVQSARKSRPGKPRPGKPRPRKRER